jgi:hypothetical protein
MKNIALASSRSERLITLPTRGVFAEGKLGHCNISEEIDNTRFWKWEEHPIPIEAPGINPVTPIQPQPQQVTATPTTIADYTSQHKEYHTSSIHHKSTHSTTHTTNPTE